MEKACVAGFSAIIVLCLSIHVKGDAGYTAVHGCSNYTFHQNSEKKWYDWFESRNECRKAGYDLVSIESRKEWNFLNKSIQTLRTGEYFIGLKKDETSGEWRWISDNSKVNASTKGAWPWAKDEPSNDQKVPENCAKMYKDYWSNYGRYDDVPCKRKSQTAGYICERAFKCNVETERPHEPEASQTSFKESPTRVSTAQTSQSSNSKLSTTENQLTFHLSTKGITLRGIPSKNTIVTGKPNFIVIVSVLLAIFLLAMLIVFGLLFVRRRRSQEKRYNRRVLCTYEIPSTSDEQSIDHGQQTQSCAEHTVHISRMDAGPTTYETVSDHKIECEYATIDKNNRKSRSNGEGYLAPRDGKGNETESDGGRGALEQSPTSVDDGDNDKEKEKEHVYAVVHKDKKGGASGASFDNRAQCSQQEGTPGLPVNRSSPVGTVSRLSSLETGNRFPSMELVNRSSLSTETGLEINAVAAGKETPGASAENMEYLYAVVDKANKKKKPPQMPPPYHGLVYADLIHSKDNHVKPVKKQSPTVYSKIDHVKTTNAKNLENLEQANKDERL